MLATESRNSPITAKTAMELLAVMLAKEDLAGLHLRPYEQALLLLPLDHSSTVDSTTDALAVTVQGAALRMVVSKTTTLDTGGTKSPVAYVEARFSCGVDENMDLIL